MKNPKPFDPSRDREFGKFARSVIDDLVPKMKGSAHVMVVAPSKDEKLDVYLAVQIGYAILLDKPLIAVVPAGRIVAERLLRIADHVVEMDDSSDAGRERTMQKLQAIMTQ